MSSTTVGVHPGVCGFVASIEAHSEDQRHVALRVESECESIRSLAARLGEAVDGFQEVGDGFGGRIHRAAQSTLKGCCSGCVIPSAIFKAMQVAAGLALPVDAGLRFGGRS